MKVTKVQNKGAKKAKQENKILEEINSIDKKLKSSKFSFAEDSLKLRLGADATFMLCWSIPLSILLIGQGELTVGDMIESTFDKMYNDPKYALIPIGFGLCGLIGGELYTTILNKFDFLDTDSWKEIIEAYNIKKDLKKVKRKLEEKYNKRYTYMDKDNVSTKDKVVKVFKRKKTDKM